MWIVIRIPFSSAIAVSQLCSEAVKKRGIINARNVTSITERFVNVLLRRCRKLRSQF